MAGGKLDRLLCSWRFLGVLVPENADLTWSWERATIPSNPPAGIRTSYLQVLVLGTAENRDGVILDFSYIFFCSATWVPSKRGPAHPDQGAACFRYVAGNQCPPCSGPRGAIQAIRRRRYQVACLLACWRAGVLPTRAACRWWFCVPQCSSIVSSIIILGGTLAGPSGFTDTGCRRCLVVLGTERCHERPVDVF